MRKSPSKHIFLKFTLLVLALILLVIFVAPWKSILENNLKSVAEAKGMQNVQLTISNFGFNDISIKDINIGGKTSVKLKSLDIAYSLPNILSGKTATWKADGLEIKDSGGDFPIMNGNGDLSIVSGNVNIQGIFASADQTNKTKFNVDYPVNDPEKFIITIIEATMPWNGGTISTRDIKIPLNNMKELKINLNVKQVSLDTFLNQLTGKQASATGAISGIVPVVIKPDGTFVLQEVKLQSDGEGTIAMSPEAIPGDNPQVTVVRDIMKNLHYTVMSITADNDANNKLSVNMNIEGSNPDMYEGRLVKLNVHLTGDVLNLVQQNITALNNPQKLLEQDENAKK